MKKNLSIVGVVIVVVLAALLGRSWMKRTEAARRIMGQRNFLNSVQGGKEWQQRAAIFNKNKANVAAIFNGATKVEGFRLFANGEEKPVGKTTDFSYFSKSALQDRRFAARLGAIVLNPKTYPWPGQSTKQCEFDPAVAFRIWKNKKFVDTTICFHCSQLIVAESNSEMQLGGDFDVERSSLLALTKEAFANDSNVQSLH